MTLIADEAKRVLDRVGADPPPLCKCIQLLFQLRGASQQRQTLVSATAVAIAHYLVRSWRCRPGLSSVLEMEHLTAIALSLSIDLLDPIDPRIPSLGATFCLAAIMRSLSESADKPSGNSCKHCGLKGKVNECEHGSTCTRALSAIPLLYAAQGPPHFYTPVAIYTPSIEPPISSPDSLEYWAKCPICKAAVAPVLRKLMELHIYFCFTSVTVKCKNARRGHPNCHKCDKCHHTFALSPPLSIEHHRVACGRREIVTTLFCASTKNLTLGNVAVAPRPGKAIASDTTKVPRGFTLEPPCEDEGDEAEEHIRLPAEMSTPWFPSRDAIDVFDEQHSIMMSNRKQCTRPVRDTISSIIARTPYVFPAVTINPPVFACHTIPFITGDRLQALCHIVVYLPATIYIKPPKVNGYLVLSREAITPYQSSDENGELYLSVQLSSLDPGGTISVINQNGNAFKPPNIRCFNMTRCPALPTRIRKLKQSDLVPVVNVKYNTIETLRNGNCLYEAIASSLYCTPITAAKAKGTATKRIGTNSTLVNFLRFASASVQLHNWDAMRAGRSQADDDPDNPALKCIEVNSWGDEIDIECIATALKCKINVIKYYQDTHTSSITVFGESDHLSRPAHFHTGLEASPHSEVITIMLDGNHYYPIFKADATPLTDPEPITPEILPCAINNSTPPVAPICYVSVCHAAAVTPVDRPSTGSCTCLSIASGILEPHTYNALLVFHTNHDVNIKLKPSNIAGCFTVRCCREPTTDRNVCVEFEPNRSATLISYPKDIPSMDVKGIEAPPTGRIPPTSFRQLSADRATIDTIGDGNCLFDALSAGLFSQEITQSDGVRTAATRDGIQYLKWVSARSQIHNMPKLYTSWATCPSSFAQPPLKCLERNGWGSDIDIQAIATALGVTVTVKQGARMVFFPFGRLLSKSPRVECECSKSVELRLSAQHYSPVFNLMDTAKPPPEQTILSMFKPGSASTPNNSLRQSYSARGESMECNRVLVYASDDDTSVSDAESVDPKGAKRERSEECSESEDTCISTASPKRGDEGRDIETAGKGFIEGAVYDQNSMDGEMASSGDERFIDDEMVVDPYIVNVQCSECGEGFSRPTHDINDKCINCRFQTEATEPMLSGEKVDPAANTLSEIFGRDTFNSILQKAIAKGISPLSYVKMRIDGGDSDSTAEEECGDARKCVSCIHQPALSDSHFCAACSGYATRGGLHTAFAHVKLSRQCTVAFTAAYESKCALVGTSPSTTLAAFVHPRAKSYLFWEANGTWYVRHGDNECETGNCKCETIHTRYLLLQGDAIFSARCKSPVKYTASNLSTYIDTSVIEIAELDAAFVNMPSMQQPPTVNSVPGVGVRETLRNPFTLLEVDSSCPIIKTQMKKQVWEYLPTPCHEQVKRTVRRIAALTAAALRSVAVVSPTSFHGVVMGADVSVKTVLNQAAAHAMCASVLLICASDLIDTANRLADAIELSAVGMCKAIPVWAVIVVEKEKIGAFMDKIIASPPSNSVAGFVSADANYVKSIAERASFDQSELFTIARVLLYTISADSLRAGGPRLSLMLSAIQLARGANVFYNAKSSYTNVLVDKYIAHFHGYKRLIAPTGCNEKTSIQDSRVYRYESAEQLTDAYKRDGFELEGNYN